jgi:hypothetical protein
VRCPSIMICTAIYAQINTKTEVGGSLSPGDAIDRFCTGLLDSRRSRKAPQGCRLRSDNGRLPISTLVDPSPSAQTVPTRALKRFSSSPPNGSRAGIAYSFDRTPSTCPGRRRSRRFSNRFRDQSRNRRHDELQRFMLATDSVTVAVEVVFLNLIGQ